MHRLSPHLPKESILSKIGKQPSYHIHRNKNIKVGKMRQHKNMFQNKEQDKIPGELSKVMMTIRNLPSKEYKVIITVGCCWLCSR